MKRATGLLIGSILFIAAMACMGRGPAAETGLPAQSEERRAMQKPPVAAHDVLLWLAARYEAQATHHEIEARRIERQALALTPQANGRTNQRQQLLAEARSHWRKALELHTHATLHQTEASQLQP